jgi:cytochrome c5
MSDKRGWRLWTSFALIFFVALLAGPLYLSGGRSWAGQEKSDPANPATVEKGKEVYGQVCLACHNARYTMMQRKNSEGWRRTVYRMISRGAQVMPDEVSLLTAYLTATYGPASPPPIPSDSSALPGRRALPEGAGRGILVGSCSQCHSVQVVADSRKPQTDWKATVGRMRSLGAKLSDSEEQALVDYLSRHFAP